MIKLGKRDERSILTYLPSLYRAIQITAEIKISETKCNTALQNSILYIILSPYVNHQSHNSTNS